LPGKDKREGGEEEKCGIVGCEEKAYKSLSSTYFPLLQQLGLQFKAVGKRVKLCRKHYREVRKIRRKVRQLF